MTWVLVWCCAEYVRAQLERAYFLDLLDTGEDAPEVYIVGCVTTKRKRRADIGPLWRGARA
jgi:hypothetical protein